MVERSAVLVWKSEKNACTAFSCFVPKMLFFRMVRRSYCVAVMFRAGLCCTAPTAAHLLHYTYCNALSRLLQLLRCTITPSVTTPSRLLQLPQCIYCTASTALHAHHNWNTCCAAHTSLVRYTHDTLLHSDSTPWPQYSFTSVLLHDIISRCDSFTSTTPLPHVTP